MLSSRGAILNILLNNNKSINTNLFLSGWMSRLLAARSLCSCPQNQSQCPCWTRGSRWSWWTESARILPRTLSSPWLLPPLWPGRSGPPRRTEGGSCPLHIKKIHLQRSLCSRLTRAVLTWGCISSCPKTTVADFCPSSRWSGSPWK